MYQRHQIADLADGQLPRKLDRSGRGACHAKLCMQALYTSRSSRGTKAYRGKGCSDEKTFLLVLSVCNGWADKHIMAFQHPRIRGLSSIVKTKSAWFVCVTAHVVIARRSHAFKVSSQA